jgi:hypothetical protein
MRGRRLVAAGLARLRGVGWPGRVFWLGAGRLLMVLPCGRWAIRRC